MAKRNLKPTLQVAKDLKVASSREALNESSIAEVEQIRKACRRYIEVSEPYYRRKIISEIRGW